MEKKTIKGKEMNASNDTPQKIAIADMELNADQLEAVAGGVDPFILKDKIENSTHE